MPSNRLTLATWLLLCSAVICTSCSKPEPETESIRPVKAMQVGKPDRLAKVSFTGKAKAKREVSVAFEVPGRIITMPVRVGDAVDEGQELASLDPRDYANSLARAEAEFIRASAQRERIAKALETRAVAEQDLTDATAAADAAEAMVKIAKKQLEDTTLRAPFAGTVVARYLENFENTLAKQRVMRLLDISQVEMVIDVPESMIPDVPHVTSIEVQFAAFPGLTVSAWITEVGSEASLTTRTYPVTLRMDQPESAQILAGMAGQVSITAELPASRLDEGITIMASAIFSPNESQDSYVWIFDETTGTVHQRQVSVDRFSRYGMVTTQGLKPGEWVVTAGVHSLTEGQTVRLLDEQL